MHALDLAVVVTCEVYVGDVSPKKGNAPIAAVVAEHRPVVEREDNAPQVLPAPSSGLLQAVNR